MILSWIRSPEGIMIKGTDVKTTKVMSILKTVGSEEFGSSESMSPRIPCTKIIEIKSPINTYAMATIESDILVAFIISFGSPIDSSIEYVKGTRPNPTYEG